MRPATSHHSTSVSVTTASVADTTPPSTPTGLTGAPRVSTAANLSWSASTDNVGVTGYIVRRNGVQVATPATSSYTDTGLSAATTYSYTVAARDRRQHLTNRPRKRHDRERVTRHPPSTPTGLTARRGF